MTGACDQKQNKQQQRNKQTKNKTKQTTTKQKRKKLRKRKDREKRRQIAMHEVFLPNGTTQSKNSRRTETKSPKDLPGSKTEPNEREVILEQRPRQKRALARAERSGPERQLATKTSPKGKRTL